MQEEVQEDTMQTLELMFLITEGALHARIPDRSDTHKGSHAQQRSPLAMQDLKDIE